MFFLTQINQQVSSCVLSVGKLDGRLEYECTVQINFPRFCKERCCQPYLGRGCPPRILVGILVWGDCHVPTPIRCTITPPIYIAILGFVI